MSSDVAANHHRDILYTNDGDEETHFERWEFESSCDDMGPVFAVLTAIAIASMPDALRREFICGQRKYFKSVALNPELYEALGDSFITDIFKAAEDLGLIAKYLQVYYEKDDGGCTSHQDEKPKILFKLNGRLDLTAGRDNCLEPKEVVGSVDCEGKMILLNGTKTAALTGVDPTTGTQTGIHHKNFVLENIANVTGVLYPNFCNPDSDLVPDFVASIEKVIEKWTNGEQISRVNTALKKWLDPNVAFDDAAMQKAMEKLPSDFNTNTDRPTRVPTEAEKLLLVGLYPEIRVLLRDIHRHLEAFHPHSKYHEWVVWMDKYKELEEYKLNHGDCLVSESHENYPLATWVNRQRHQKN
jgi:hypothetical protein